MSSSDSNNGVLADLPLEPSSISEILSASHLFTVEILSFQATPWNKPPNQLQTRSITMEVRLKDIFKGKLLQAPAKTFELKAVQKRESLSMVNDYHGLWSHVRPEPNVGVSYLVISKDQTAEPADAARLMQDGPCQALRSLKSANDIVLARQAENLFQTALHASGRPNPSLDAAKVLFEFADTHAAAAEELFARYLWARERSVILNEKPGVRADVLALLAKQTASQALRFELAVRLADIISALSNDSEFMKNAGQTLVVVLLDPDAKFLHNVLVNVSFYRFVFSDESHARIKPKDLVPDQAKRAKLEASIKAITSPHSEQLLHWLLQ